jgi:hypothetical protein
MVGGIHCVLMDSNVIRDMYGPYTVMKMEWFFFFLLFFLIFRSMSGHRISLGGGMASFHHSGILQGSGLYHETPLERKGGIGQWCPESLLGDHGQTYTKTFELKQKTYCTISSHSSKLP